MPFNWRINAAAKRLCMFARFMVAILKINLALILLPFLEIQEALDSMGTFYNRGNVIYLHFCSFIFITILNSFFLFLIQILCFNDI